MYKYEVVDIINFQDQEDFEYVMRLLEQTGYLFHYPVEHYFDKIDWRRAKIYSSPVDAHQLYVTDTNDEIYKSSRTIDLKNYS